MTESVKRMTIGDDKSGSLNKVKSGSVKKKKSSKKSKNRSSQDPIRAAERRYRQRRQERVDNDFGVSNAGGSSSVMQVSSASRESSVVNQRFGIFIKIRILF